MGGMKCQGISKVGQAVLARLMTPRIWHWPAGSVAVWWEGSERGNGLCPPFFLRQNCPPALTLMPDTSVPPHVQLVPFKLLPWCWSSERVNLSKSMCGFSKGNCLGFQQLLLLTQSPLVFAARSRRDLSSWHWNTGLGILVWSWDSSFPRYPSQIFIHNT